MSDKLSHAQSVVSDHMDKILRLFKPGCRITVLVRTPDAPDCDFMMTDDDPREVIAMIGRRLAEAGK